MKRRVYIVSAVAVALGALTLLLPTARAHLYSAWLAEWTSMTTLLCGALFWVQIAHLTAAAWLAPLRRILENVASALPVVALGAIPIAIEQRAWFIAVPSMMLYVALAELLRAASLREAPETLFEMRWISGPGVALMGLVFTVMTFEMIKPRELSSTVWALFLFAGGMLASLSLAVIVAERARRASLLPIKVDHFFAAGKMMLTFTIFWAYTSFSQLLLFWIANKPSEVVYYEPRFGPFAWLGLTILIGHFAVPFALLLSWELKRRPAWLAGLGAWLLVMHRLDTAWIVIPTYRARFPALADVACSLVMVGAVAAVIALRWRGFYAKDVVMTRALAWEDR